MLYEKYLVTEDSEPITRKDLNILEKLLDNLYKSLNIDVEFGKHFFDRVNDTRNKRQITIGELRELFTKAYARHAQKFPDFEKAKIEAILIDLQTDINVPFLLKFNRKSGMIEMHNKTIMRKKGFRPNNPRDRALKV